MNLNLFQYAILDFGNALSASPNAKLYFVGFYNVVNILFLLSKPY